MSVNHRRRSGGLKVFFLCFVFLSFFNMKVCCLFSLELSHRGDSNEYAQYTIFNTEKKSTLNYLKSEAMGCFSQGLKNEFE